MIESPIETVENLPNHLAAALEETDVYIYTLGPKSPIPWEKIPVERRKAISVWLDTRYDKSKFAQQWARVARRRKVRMVAIEATLATPERAPTLGLDSEEWKRMMFAGCMADPRKMASRGQVLESVLSGRGQVHVTSPFGSDFKFELDERPVDYSYGLATEDTAEKGEVVFLPTGGIEVSAAEDSADGEIVYDTKIRSGKGQVEDLTLRVVQGHIKEFSAKSGKEIFDRYLREGSGDENRFAYFGFGLNPELRFGFGQDDKVLGSTVIGFGHTAKGGKNIASGTWWASMTKATVTVNGQGVMKDGRLLV
jgi:leucyl aminopeptidase (aminopeptidase T)